MFMKHLGNETVELDRVVIREIKPEEVDEIFSISSTSPLNPWSKRMLLEEMTNPISHSFLIERKEERSGSLIFMQKGTVGFEMA